MITDLEPIAADFSLSSIGRTSLVGGEGRPALRSAFDEGGREEAVASLPQTDFSNWGSHTMSRLGTEFQIGDLLIRRVGGDQFLIWNTDGEMLQSESAKVESTLREFFNEEF